MFNVILPIFAIILCGLLAGRFALLPTSGAKTLNSFVYYFALPGLLFFSLSDAPIKQITNVNFFLVNIITIICCFVVAIFVFKLTFKKTFPEVMMYGMASSYGNTGFLGIPLLIAAFGEEAAVPAAIATFIYDILIVTVIIVSFETAKIFSDKGKDVKVLPMIGSTIKAVLLNPINASLLLGIIAALLQLPIPSPVSLFADTLGAAASPTALFALGLGLVRDKDVIKDKALQLNEMGSMIGLKLLFQPLVALFLVSFIFPLNDLWATTVVIISAVPTGAIVNVFAERYDTLVKQVPFLLLLSTGLSIITLTIFLMITVGI